MLERPLESNDIKSRLLGHWGTCPGITLAYNCLKSFDSEIGFSGDVMGITSHGEGSVVITLDQDNILIAGDLEPLEYMDAYEKGTPYRNDWDRIMKNSPKRVCYAHSGARDIAKYGIS